MLRSALFRGVPRAGAVTHTKACTPSRRFRYRFFNMKTTWLTANEHCLQPISVLGPAYRRSSDQWGPDDASAGNGVDQPRWPAHPPPLKLPDFLALMRRVLALHRVPRAYLCPSPPVAGKDKNATFRPDINPRSRAMASRVRPRDVPVHELLHQVGHRDGRSSRSPAGGASVSKMLSSAHSRGCRHRQGHCPLNARPAG